MYDEKLILKQVIIDEATITLTKDGIVTVLFHSNVRLDVKLQLLLLNIYKDITGNIPHPFLFEALEDVKISREARDNAIRIEPQVPGLAYAVVAKSLPYRIIANFYVRVKRPKGPYKVFSKRNEAQAWLKSFVG